MMLVAMLFAIGLALADQERAPAEPVLQIYDLGDLVEFDAVESAFYLPNPKGADPRRADPADVIVARDAARVRAIERLHDHFARIVDGFDAAEDDRKSVQRTQNALIVRATPWTHQYVKSVLDRVRESRTTKSPVDMRLVAFEIDGALAAELGLDGSAVQLVTSSHRSRFWEAQFCSEDPPVNEGDARLVRRAGKTYELGLLVDVGSRGDAAAPFRRFVTGYDRFEGVWPNDRTIFVPRVKTVPFPTARFSGVPLPGRAYEVEMAFDSVVVIAVEESTGEGGPFSIPTLEEFHFESRVVMEPDNWLFATLERGARWKMIAVWMAPRD